jgi:aminopeptidase N
MERDGCAENFAIELPGATEVVINTSTAPIIYSKGGSILRQIRSYIGEDAFREGVRLYLKTHAYSCAESGHLWAAFDRQPTGGGVMKLGRQPGLPLVTAARDRSY